MLASVDHDDAGVARALLDSFLERPMRGQGQESEEAERWGDGGVAMACGARVATATPDVHLVLVNTGPPATLWERQDRRWTTRRLGRGETSILPAPRTGALRWEPAGGLVAITLASPALRGLAHDAGLGRVDALEPVRRTRDAVLLGLARLLRLEAGSADGGGFEPALRRVVGLHLVRRYGVVVAGPRLDLDPALQRALDHVEANLARPLRLADLARVAFLSPYHFARRFKAVLGVPPHEWVMQRRIARAARLLEGGGGAPLAHVASLVGFADQSHFTRQFRRRMGTTPRRFLAAHAVTARGTGTSA